MPLAAFVDITDAPCELSEEIQDVYLGVSHVVPSSDIVRLDEILFCFNRAAHAIMCIADIYRDSDVPRRIRWPKLRQHRQKIISNSERLFRIPKTCLINELTQPAWHAMSDRFASSLQCKPCEVSVPSHVGNH